MTISKHLFMILGGSDGDCIHFIHSYEDEAFLLMLLNRMSGRSESNARRSGKSRIFYHWITSRKNGGENQTRTDTSFEVDRFSKPAYALHTIRHVWFSLKESNFVLHHVKVSHVQCAKGKICWSAKKGSNLHVSPLLFLRFRRPRRYSRRMY